MPVISGISESNWLSPTPQVGSLPLAQYLLKIQPKRIPWHNYPICFEKAGNSRIEPDVIPSDIPMRTRGKRTVSIRQFPVGWPRGVEPLLADSQSAVLPLHHDHHIKSKLDFFGSSVNPMSAHFCTAPICQSGYHRPILTSVWVVASEAGIEPASSILEIEMLPLHHSDIVHSPFMCLFQRWWG